MWHVRFAANDVRKGTFEQLQALAAKGKISATTEVRAPDSQHWVTAGSVSGLLPAETGLEPLADDLLGNLSAFETPRNPLGAPSPLSAPSPASTGGNNNQLLLWGGIGGGGVLLVVIAVVVVAMSMGGSSTPAVATNSTPPVTTPTPPAPVTPPPSSSSSPATTTTSTVAAANPASPTTQVANTATPTATTTPTNNGSSTNSQPPAPSNSPPPAANAGEIQIENVAAPSKPAPTSDLTLPELINLVQPSIVRIDVQTELGGSVGSGFVVDDKGTVVTNLHVVAGGKAAKLTFADKTTVDVTSLLVVNEKKDIAILRFDTSKAKSLPLRLAPALPRDGESVAAFGAPKGLSFTTSNGIVSAVRTSEDLKQFGAEFDATMVQTSAPISPGNSGGPLVNMRGEVVGINTVQLTTGQNLNFAVSCLDVKMMLDTAKDARPLTELAKYEQKTSSAVTLKDIESQQKEALKLPELIEEDWTIGGQVVRATLVGIQTTEKEPRTPVDLDAADFSNGKYNAPKGLRVKLKSAGGTEKDFNMSQLGTNSMKRVRDRWHEEVYTSIKRKLIARGNDRIRSMLIAIQRGDGQRVSAAAQAVSMMYLFGDAALPKEHSAHLRKLVAMNFDVLGSADEKERINRILGDMESQLRVAVKSSPDLQVVLSETLREMLAQPE